MPVLRGDLPADLDLAAEVLARGDLLAFPTETVYGLGARADDDTAVAGIFRAKGRPADHPLIVHVADAAAAATFAADWPPAAAALASAFWPGPVTVIVARRAGVAGAAAGGHATIGLRCPDHPVALALLRRAAARGVPGVAGPSANRFGRVSPTTAAHVVDEFGATLPVLDGGPCGVGIESAIVDCRGPRAVLLRPGVLTRERLAAALGSPLAEPSAGHARAPGTLAAHYAPRAPVRLVDGPGLLETPQVIASAGAAARVGVYCRLDPGVPGRVLWRRMPDDPQAVARELFAVLRAFDAEGVSEIRVEQPPADEAWEGVRDRLRRAAAHGD
jgi:L-threonylcarbamoyladenylate synthase